MPTFHLHLKNVPPEAGTLDIRHFFSQFDIPEEGVQIVGGPEGTTFVTFSNNEDLLKATSYDKSYLMGRQLVVNLVNGNDIKQIVEEMRQKFPVQNKPMEMLPVQQISQTKRPAKSRGSFAQAAPPGEPTLSSEDHLEQKQQAAVPPVLPDDSHMFAGSDAKRMRLDSQLSCERGLAASNEDNILTASEESLTKELEMELRDAQEIVDILKEKKERIKKLKHSIIGKDMKDTVARAKPVVDEKWAPEITHSRVESRHPNLHAVKADRYQYERGEMMQSDTFQSPLGRPTKPAICQRKDAVKHQSFRSTEDPRFDRMGSSETRSVLTPGQYGAQDKGYNHEKLGYPRPSLNSDDPRYPGPQENYENPRYTGPNENSEYNQRRSDRKEGYSTEDPQYPGPSENYEDQRHRGKNERYSAEVPRYPQHCINYEDPRYSENYVAPSFHGRGQNYKDPKYTEASVNYEDPRYIGQNEGDNHENSRYTGPSKNYKEQAYSGKKEGYNAEYPRYPKPSENYEEDPRYGSQNEGYNHEDPTTYPGPSVNYEDQSFSHKSEGYSADEARYPGSSENYEDQTYSHKSEGYGAEETRYPGSSENYKDQTYSHKSEGYGADEARYPGSSENYEDQTYSHKSEGYGAEETRYPGSSENYEDQRYSHKTEGYGADEARYPGSSENCEDQGYSHKNEGFTAEEARYPGPSQNCEDQGYSGKNEGCNSEDPTSAGQSENYEGPWYSGPSENYEESWYSGENYEESWYSGPGENYQDPWCYGPSENYTDQGYSEQNEGDNCEDTGYRGHSPNHKDTTLIKNRGRKRRRDQNRCESACNVAYGGSNGRDALHPNSAGPATPKMGVYRALFFLALNTLSEDQTASSIWQTLGGPHGDSVGVLLLDMKGDRSERMAFVAYEASKTKIKQHAGSRLSSMKTVYGSFANALPASKMYKATPAGEDIELSDNEKALLKQKFLLNVAEGFPPPTGGMLERREQVHVLNGISRILFDLRSTEENRHISIYYPKQVCYLHLGHLPTDATACKVWSWFGGATGPSPHVILTEHKNVENPDDLKIAFVAFKDSKSRDAAKKKYKNSCKSKGIHSAFRSIARACNNPDIQLFKSTDTGSDEFFTEQQRLAFKKEWHPEEELSYAESPYILQIPGISLNNSACQVWSWFGGEKGAAQGVILMEDGQTRIAFIRFSDPLKCNQEQMKYQSSKTITVTEMLNMLATHSSGDIIKSSLLGDCPMPASERHSLVERFYPDKKPATIQTRKKVQTSDDTSEGHASSAPVKEQKDTCSTPTDSIKPALCFLSLNSLRKNTTAFSVWKQFGGSSGRSRGVLLLVHKRKGKANMAFVAYERSDDREADMHLHAGAVPRSCSSVYKQCAQSSEYEMYKTIPYGYVKISESERAMFKQKFLRNRLHKHPQFKSENQMEQQQHLNRISSALFDVKDTEEKKDKTAVCYLRLHDLHPDTTASEVWSWYCGVSGRCLPVVMIRTSTLHPDRAKLAYVAFKDCESRDAAMTKHSRCQRMTGKGAAQYIAQSCTWPNTEIFKSTDAGVDEVMAEDEKLAFIKEHITPRQKNEVQVKPEVKKNCYTGTFNPALYFVTLKRLPESETATSVWEKFGGSLGSSVGALLLERKDERTGFVAYENIDERNAAIHLYAESRAWSDRVVYSKYVNSTLETKMFKTSPTGDVEISVDTKVFLNEDMYIKSFKKNPKSDKQKDDQQLILNAISRTLFDVKITSEEQKAKFQSEVSAQSELCYLELDQLPQATTACDVWSWYGGAAGPCLQVTLTSHHHNQTNAVKVAHVAFSDYESRNAEKQKYGCSRSLTEKGALHRIAHAATYRDTEIFKSTDTGVDDVMTKEEKVALKAKWDPEGEIIDEDAPYVLQIQRISFKDSASKVWSWFGGQKGAAQGVTLMKNGDTTIAFVRFSDPVKCIEKQAIYEFSEVITETKMLEMLAACPYDSKIITSVPSGDQTMSQMKQLALRENFDLTNLT